MKAKMIEFSGGLIVWHKKTSYAFVANNKYLQ